MTSRHAVVTASAALPIGTLAASGAAGAERAPDPVSALYTEWQEAHRASEAATDARAAAENVIAEERGYRWGRVLVDYRRVGGTRIAQYASSESHIVGLDPKGTTLRQNRLIARLRVSWAEWEALCTARGVAEFCRIEDEAQEREETAWKRIAGTPATTTPGVLLKLLAASQYSDWSAAIDDPQARCDLDEMLIASAVRDLRALSPQNDWRSLAALDKRPA